MAVLLPCGPAMELKIGFEIFLFPLILLSLLITRTAGDSLDTEFSKLIKEEKYLVALLP